MKNSNIESARLTIKVLKKNNVSVKGNLEKISGGDFDSCHYQRQVIIFGIDMTWLYGRNWYNI